ncbi:MAG: ATP-binding protein [Propionibacteriaceae bacterium]|nr:ATP-binding protein [Propionibacteriaceae bacterium]
MEYRRRVIDQTLDEVIGSLPAIAIEGAKGVGKTATATQRAADVFTLDHEGVRQTITLAPELVLQGRPPTFIDEWQMVPAVWNEVRHAVDAGAPAGRFLLAGSATPSPGARLHSGAGRIVRLVMRPMTLPERGLTTPTVSLAALLAGGGPDIAGRAELTTVDYVREIIASGFPGIRAADATARPYLLDSYVARLVDHDIAEAGGAVRRPQSLLNWLRAYAAATATTASYTSLLDAATPGDEAKPAKQTATVWRDLLQRLWVLDPLPAWLPTASHLKRLGLAPKHHLVDPALAAHLVGATADSLIRGQGPARPGDSTFLGALFESLAAQTVRVLAEANRAQVFHLRTQGGEHEIDLIVRRPDGQVVVIEVKLSSAVRPADVAHLNWLARQSPHAVIDRVVLNTEQRAYRRPDGIAVVPLGLLGL